MRRVLTAFTLVLGLAACGGNLAESLVLTNETIASSARATETALAQGHVSVSDACRVESYGRFAGAAVDQAWVNYVLGNPETAEQHLNAARQAISGSLPDAQRLADTDCGSEGS